MHSARLSLFALVVLVSACGRQPDDSPVAAAGPVDAAGTVAEAAPEPAFASGDTTAGASGHASSILVDEAGAPVPLVAFDPASVPLAASAPGALPVFSLPHGYAATDGPQVRAYARFPFRMGNGVHWVEGPSWSARVGVDDDAVPGKQYSPLELRRNLEAVLAQAGARPVYQGTLGRGLYYGSVAEEIGSGFIDVVNHDAETPTLVYVIRHGDRTVWIQLVIDASEAGIVAVDETPFQATSRWSDAFPHVSLPSGYDHRNAVLERDYDAFSFWTGRAFEEVEGKAYAVDFDAEEDTYSMHEVRRNLEAMMDAAGGVLVHAGPVPAAEAEKIASDRKRPYGNAAGYDWSADDRSTWRVDLDGGRQVWVHARLDPRTAGWVVVERTGFEQTAALLAAGALKQQIDSAGRVAIEVNFAVDEAEILPTSKPQLDQVVALLRADPALRLSVDGHTDASGDAARNRTLSASRAQSVVAALVAAGIAGDRLQAQGHGADRPLADNATADGKARNRRVELVKL